MITEKEARKRLKILLEKVEREKHPSYPEHLTIATKKYDVRKANGLTQAVIAVIRCAGYQAERINTTGRQIDNRKEFIDVVGIRRTVGSLTWIPGTGTKGSADISATIKGRSVKIEIKIGRDRQSQAQLDYQADVERAGGIYVIIKTLEDFFQWFDNFLLTFK